MRILYLILSFFCLVSCGKISPEGDLVIDNKKLESFRNIDLKGKFRVFYVNAPQNSISIQTYQNIAQNLDISVKNETLSIFEKRETKAVDFYEITIYSENPLEKIAVSDSVELNVSGEIKTQNIHFNLKNNAIFIGSINAENAHLEMQDTSRANFKGKTKNVELKIADTANVIAPYWFVNVLKINSENGNYVEMNIKDTLKGSLKNTSKLMFYGSPITQLKTEKSTKVERKEDL